MRRHVRVWCAAVAISAVVVGAAPAYAASSAPRTVAAESGRGARPAGCAAGVGLHCYLSAEPAAEHGAPAAAGTCPVDAATGYTPCNIQDAYGVADLVGDRPGRLVAVVDFYDDPNAEADLAVYRSTYGLPPCTTANGCFKKVNQLGQRAHYPAAKAAFAGETALDIEMVSVTCPNCHILLVEANSNGFADAMTAIHEAVVLKARVISNSWGTGEFVDEQSFDSTLDVPGIALTFSSGDGAYGAGVQFPSASPFVTSVGGTQLTPSTNARGWAESAWVTPGHPITQGAGSGCSAFEGKPAWQTDPSCPMRMTSDVSAVAANVLSYNTYDSGGTWFYSFGTSVSSPLIAGLYGLAENSPSIAVPASAAYAAPSATRRDIRTGTEGTCTVAYFCKSGVGYDGPTGLGVPNGYRMLKTPTLAAPTFSSIVESGSASAATITVTGTNFGTYPVPGAPEVCNQGDTGDVFGDVGLSFEDVTNGWTAGRSGDCIGLVMKSWSPTSIVFGFGNQYSSYGPVVVGDHVTFELQGYTVSDTVS